MDFYNIDKGLETLNPGAFIAVRDNNDRTNVMTIGWGQAGVLWGEQVFLIYVRNSRYTYELLENSNDFTVSLVEENTFKKELAVCGTRSGRDMDKIRELNLDMKESQLVRSPYVKDALISYECEILMRVQLDKDNISDKGLQDRYYPNGDNHMLYIGRVLKTHHKI